MSLADLLIALGAAAAPIYGLGWTAGHRSACTSLADRIVALKKENENLRLCLEMRGDTT